MATNSVPIMVSDNSEEIVLRVDDGSVRRSLQNTGDAYSAPLSIDDIDAISLGASDNDSSNSLGVEQRSPYYVGARAYVEQTEEGAVVTIIDREGTTTATIRNGRDGGVTDYEDLDSKPQIEGVTLIGNKTYEELNLISITNSEIEALSL